jgi:hypothetical protein
MIDPTFLASLRQRHRAEMVLVLVQLEQVAPGWWLTLSELAEQLGTDRATLNRSLSKLDELNLLRYVSLSNCGGTWIWWVATHQGAAPNPKDEPGWMLRDIKQRVTQYVPISGRWRWADRHRINHNTLRSFLAGHQQTMAGRWQIVSSPMDCCGSASALADA